MSYVARIWFLVLCVVMAACGGTPSSTSSESAPAGELTRQVSAAVSTPSISPASATVTTPGTQTFTASSGTAPYTWAITSNASGGTITAAGLYTAGTLAGTDVVTVTDFAGQTSTANVTVIGASTAVTIFPASLSISPSKNATLSVQGGTAPYTWLITTSMSATPSLAPANGATTTYTSGMTSGKTDVVKVSDSAGHSTTISIGVTSSPTAVAMYPAGPLELGPGSTLTFRAVGGTTSYTFSLTGTSGGSIDATTGAYLAGTTCGADVVKVTDSASHTATTTVNVGTSVTVSPATAGLVPGQTQQYTASGCKGAPYLWADTSTTVHGSINASTGLYTAPATVTATSTDTVQATSGGSSATASAVNELAMTFTPATGNVYQGTTTATAVTAKGGSGSFSSCLVTSGASACSITSGGAVSFVAAASPETATVLVTDSQGHTASTTVTVYGTVQASPAGPVSTVPNAAGTVLTATNGGGTYTWTLGKGTGSTGTISATSGGTITYTPGTGSAAGFADTVTLKDTGSSQSVVVTINVGPKLAIAASVGTPVPVNAQQTITASGGSGSYKWAISGTAYGTLSATTGTSVTYTASSTSSKTDTIVVTDATYTTATAQVAITDSVSIAITGTTSVSPGTTETIKGWNNAGTYTWTLASPSGGSYTGSGQTLTYTAGPNNNSVDTFRLTDQWGNTAALNITVLLSVTPSTVTLAPGGTTTLTALPTGTTCVSWTLGGSSGSASLSSSGGTTSTTYTAGATAGSIDTVKCTDANGNVAVARITVGLSVTPSTVTVAPGASTTLTATETCSAWALSANSGAATLSSTGGSTTTTYTAGSAGGTTDTVKCTDAGGNVAVSKITVGVALSPSPATLSPGGTQTFTASATCVTWSLSSQSGSTTTPTNGTLSFAYTAGPKSGTTDVLTCTDASGNVATAKITVGLTLTVSVSNATVAPGGTATVTLASAGANTCTWSVTGASNTPSFVSTTATTASYRAGQKIGTIDTVTCTDANGNVAVAKITVALSIGLSATTVAPGGTSTLTLTTNSGTDTCVSWAFSTTASGSPALSAASGTTTVYTAGHTTGTVDTVACTDTFGNVATAKITVGLTITPASATLPPGALQTFSASAACTWTISGNSNTGTISAGSGTSTMYTAGHASGGFDVVTCTDAYGNVATSKVTVALAIATALNSSAVTALTVAPTQTQALYVAGASSPFTGQYTATYTWSVSGTSTTPAVKPAGGITTVYTAGAKLGTDIVTLTDQWGNSATLTMTSGLVVSSSGTTVAPGGMSTFTVPGAASCTWSLTLTASGSPSISTTTGNSTIYTAGHTGGTIDILQCVDAAGNTTIVKIAVTLAVTASPLTTSVTPGGSLTLLVANSPFSGTAYTWALTANGSGSPTISSPHGLTTLYTAGQSPGSDTITLTDPWGNSASYKVTAGVVITPGPTSVSPGATVAFTLSNGPAAGVTYTWAITSSGSGSPALSTTTGLGTTYTAGHGAGTDILKVTDSNGNSGTATITVAVQISPATATIASGGTQSFSVTGALAGAYTWSSTTSSGSPVLSPSTGLTSVFTAGHTGGVTETVTVTDPWGNKGTSTVTITGLTLTASATTIGPTGTITLKASGGAPSVGTGQYAWSFIATGSTGPSVSPTSGPVVTYTAGTKNGVDAIKVQDAWGNSATTTITVQFAITLVPSTVAPSGQASLGSNEGGSLSWTISTNNSGGTIGATSGNYQAGSNGGVSDIVTATDPNGNKATASIPVGETLTIAPNNPSVSPGGAITFTATGGSGSGYTWSVLTNLSGGSIVAASGAYTAGSTPSQDVIQVTDSYGNTTTTTVTVVCGADSSLQILYPYNHTVLPLGLSPPLVQWSDNGTASYAKVTLQYPATGTATFTWSEVVTENGPLSSPYNSLPAQLPVTAGGRAQIPSTVWTAFSNTAAGNDALLSVQTLENGSGSTPTTITIHFVNAQLTGTIYYQSYGSGMVQNAGSEGVALPNGTGFGGATLAIQVGAATPTVAAGYSSPGTSSSAEAGCRVCHSVASGGSFLITQEGANYPTSDIVSLPNDVDTPIASSTNDGRYAWPAISPDGTMLFSNSGSNPGTLSGSNGSIQSGLYGLPAGNALSTTGIPSGLHAMMPAFANDTSAVAFNYNSYDAKSLAMMNVSSAGSTWNFTSPSVLFTPAQGTVVWPSFLPAGQNGVVFEDQIQYNCQETGATNASVYAADLRHNIGALGELWWVNTSGTPVAARLANANGEGYLPRGVNGHGIASSPPTTTTGGIPTQSQLLQAGADSCRLSLGQAIGNGDDSIVNYEPTVNPTVTGGYSWVVFTSRRMYGNVATVNPWASDPRFADTSVQPTPKKLWVAAVDANGTPGDDPSHPAFYLPGQELLAGNSRGYWVLNACAPPSTTPTSASVCNTTADCCQSTPSTCTLDIPIATSPPTRHCVPNSSSSCSADGAACNTDGDCCNLATEGARCASGICQRPSQLVYTSPRTVSYDFQGTCTAGNVPVWQLLESDENVPSGTSVGFTAQTAQTEATLGAAQTASMGTVSVTVAPPQYATASQTVDAALRALSPTVVSEGWLRVNVTLNPSSDQLSTPTLTSLVPTYDCVAGE